MFKIRKSTLDRFKDGGYILYSNSKIAIVRKYGNSYKNNFKEILSAFESLLIGMGMILVSPIALFYALVGFIPIIQFIDYKEDKKEQDKINKVTEELKELLDYKEE